MGKINCERNNGMMDFNIVLHMIAHCRYRRCGRRSYIFSYEQKSSTYKSGKIRNLVPTFLILFSKIRKINVHKNIFEVKIYKKYQVIKYSKYVSQKKGNLKSNNIK